ncbi:gamma-soluble NSF attachment protein-like isoform X1 [Henckelia pumila]|uniref:gamma-soluble NSF attachment protein-like isoform X1 n=1 Tax=Henckelia pumila TaxID=405737 RepID=UPI003C6DDDA0
MAFDMYRAATSVYIKLEKYTDAATILLKWALAADKSNAAHSQCKEQSAKFRTMRVKQDYIHTMSKRGGYARFAHIMEK